MSDVQTISAKYGPACTDFAYELYQVICSLSNDTSRREIALSTILSSLKPNWVAARVADLFISTYDATCVNGTARELLQKPLSLEKIVSLLPLYCLPFGVGHYPLKPNKKEGIIRRG